MESVNESTGKSVESPFLAVCNTQTHTDFKVLREGCTVFADTALWLAASSNLPWDILQFTVQGPQINFYRVTNSNKEK